MTMIDDAPKTTVPPPTDRAAQPTELATTRPAVIIDWRSLAVRTLSLLVVLALWILAYALVFSALHEHHRQRVLYSQLREELANATAPLAGQISDGAPLAVVNAPSAGLHNVVVVQGTTAADLDSGPGHYPGTALPGQAGIATLMGRATTYGAPFRHITAMRPGDVIAVTTDQGVSHYTVTDVRVPGDPLPAPLASGSGRLTLITSANSGWRGGWTPTHAVYVDAALQSKAFQTAVSSTSSSKADDPMSGDSGGLVPLVLWLQALVLAALVVAWGRARWGARQTWLIGGAVLIALLWGASGAFMQLLPNLL
jgi:sortase A